ncbi:DUF695 domain-containing protein [Chitinophaga silvatica]|uniref:DUF695 domain-containing protein n=1 Tax=Chitinophaga silvatica TaxID=2282649 RepID=A0A3E1Y355_9BACT|nr:DUF695 domain-containing protein [Chitinophaga silvatica]RFS19093.1 DUF695 domain-containing protein [Chitinophaga silvatica]
MHKDYRPDWDIYTCHIEESPAVIGLDLDLRRFAPLKEKPNAIYITVYLNNPREDGFPKDTEFAIMGEIEDKLVDVLQTKLDAQFVGRTYSNGVRDFYFYVGETILHDKYISDVMISFPDYRYDFGVKEDNNWELYFDYLFPDVYEFQRIQNRKVLRMLQQHGDVAEKLRPIEHWIHFKTIEDRTLFWEHIKENGFTLIKEDGTENPEFPFKLCISRNDKASESAVNSVVMGLWELSQQVNALYDGWETSIMK